MLNSLQFHEVTVLQMLYSEWVYSHIFTNNDKHHLIPAQLQKISQWITSTYKTTVSTKSMQNILGQQEGWMSLESSCTVHKMSLYMSCLFVSSVQYKSTFSRQFHVTVVQELPAFLWVIFLLLFIVIPFHLGKILSNNESTI